MKKVALVVGHNIKRPGARALSPIGLNEYFYWDEILQTLPKKQRTRFKVFHRLPCGSYTREIDTVYSTLDHWGAEESIEFHFNGGGGTGTETLSSGTKGSLLLCGHLQAAMTDVMGLRDRGIKIRNKRDRGGRSLWAAAAPAALIEPFFGDSQEDVDRAHALGGARILEAILSIYS